MPRSTVRCLTASLAALWTLSPADGAEATVKPAADAASSYSVGLMFSSQWREGGLGPGLSVDALLRGIRDGLGGHALTAEDRNRAGAFLKAASEGLAERNQAAAAAFLATNAKAAGVETTASGLQYRVLARGDSSTPTAAGNDRVTVQYRGTLLDGREFDSSIARGKPAVVHPANVIPGWREALGLMNRGSKWQVFIPPALAYGGSPPPAIPPQALLIFEIEVLGIEHDGSAMPTAR